MHLIAGWLKNWRNKWWILFHKNTVHSFAYRPLKDLFGKEISKLISFMTRAILWIQYMLLVLAVRVVLIIIRVNDFNGKFYSKKCREVQLLHTSGMPKSFTVILVICATYLVPLLLLLCFLVFSFLIYLLYFNPWLFCITCKNLLLVCILFNSFCRTCGWLNAQSNAHATKG